MRRILIPCSLALAAFAFSAAAATTTAATAPSAPVLPATLAAGPVVSAQVDNNITTLDTVLVAGSQPGPGLWRVSKGMHELLIVGTLKPLPADMSWQSQEIEAAIANSQQVLGVGHVSIKAGVGTMLKMATLLPAARRVQFNADDRKLKDVLTPALHARWLAAKARYAPGDASLEKLRPMYASQQLYWKAVAAAGLDKSNFVAPVVEAATQRHAVTVVDTGLELPLHLSRKQIKVGIKGMNGDQGGGDIACFTATLDRLDRDLAAMKVRANAWAVGDVKALRGLSVRDFQPACQVVEDAAMAWSGKENFEVRLRNNWVAAADRALRDNQNTFASLPIAELLRPDGALEALRARGYEIWAPDDSGDIVPDAAAAGTSSK